MSCLEAQCLLESGLLECHEWVESVVLPCHLDEVEGDHDDAAQGEEVEARARFEGIGTYE